MLTQTLLLLFLLQPLPGISSKNGRNWYTDCLSYDPPTHEKTSFPTADKSVKGLSEHQERNLWASCLLSLDSLLTVRARKNRGFHLCNCSLCLLPDGVQTGVCADRVLLVSDEGSDWPPCVLKGKAEDMGFKNSSSLASWEKNILKTTSKAMLNCVHGKTPTSPDWDNSTGSPDSAPPGTRQTLSFSASELDPKKLYPITLCLPGTIPSQAPLSMANPVTLQLPETDTQNLGFHIQMASGAALCLVIDFGDGSVVQMRIRNVSEEIVVTACHQYRKEGVYVFKADVYDGFYGNNVELGPYYVEIGHGSISVFMNSSSIHEDEVLISADSHIDQKSTVVMHHFPFISSYNVSFTSENQVGGSKVWSSMTVWYKMQPVSVYTNGTVFATDIDVAFVAVTKETSPLEFVWHFGDDPPVRTTSRSIKRRFGIPQRYLVMVKASNGISSVVSEPHSISVQKKIVANRLMSTSSALINASVVFECRINFGTEVAYLWNFGDGTIQLGNSTNSHVFNREGEFTVEVLAFNNVSAASLRKQLFIVREPCQPPLVRNLGPGKVQIWRSQPLELGVMFEAAILCDISRGISYTWSFVRSDGSPVTLPPAVDCHRQAIALPGYFLEYGNYTAVAKVQIEGSVVHSNYSVGVEVRPRAPVSVISEGTHLFISKTPSSTIVLSGSQSYDPDHPGMTLSYHWRCTPASKPDRPCFNASPPSQLDTMAPIISFAAKDLSSSYDQFLVTLIVSNGGWNSSEAQVFLSIRSDSVFRFVHISWVNFKTIFVNWNEELSLQAVCENCDGVPNLSYTWDLFLVNATEKNSMEVPFCRSVELLDSRFDAILKLSESNPLSAESSMAVSALTATPFSWETSWKPRGPPALSAMRRPSTGSTAGELQIPAAGNTSVQEEAPGEAPVNPERAEPSGSSPTPSSSSYLSDFEAYYSDIQEAIPSKGRQPGNKSHLPGSEPGESANGNPSDGDNIIDPFHSTDIAIPSLMVDWSKSLISQATFQGYTSSGTTEQTVTVKPFSLRSGETYVIQASVASKHGLLGKAQLYLTVNKVPQDVTCQVQPHRGYEAHTLFSVFCMSGKPDFHYEFSYQIGNASKRTLFHGRDVQYYFALPAGEPLDNYKVMVSTEITDGEGSKLQPCAVAVTVLPRYHGSGCLGEDLYNSSLKNLSNLLLMGSYTETRNYITMITRILSHLAKESRSPLCGQWSQIQDALISSVCKLTFATQKEMVDSVLMLSDLINFPNKVTFASAVLILKYTQMLLSQSQFSGKLVIDRGLMFELVLLVSGVLKVFDQEKSRNVVYLQEDGIKVISDLLLSYLSSSNELQLHVGTEQMEFQTEIHLDLQNSIQSIGPLRVHLPGDLARLSPAGTETRSTCYISQLILFRKNPYPGGRAAGQINGAIGLSLYHCTSRRLISRRWLKTPVTVEFGEEDGPDDRRNKTMYILRQNKVNFHRFIGISENSLESLQIRIEFSKPITRAFPVMLLVRFSKKPTPSAFLVRQIYFWDEQIAQIYIPAVSLQVASPGYLALLDADYDIKPPNKYLAKAVNYTVHFQWIQCLLWDKKEWTSESFPPQPGTSPEKVNCSYDRLTAYAVLRRKLNASFEMSDIFELQSHTENLLPSIFIVFLMMLYAFLATQSKCVDRHEKQKMGYIFLQENAPSDQQLYAVVIDTGFRAAAQLSAKVYIILCGENGLSETKELYCPEKPLFERNSRHTFILSVPEHLGPLRKIHLWHNSCGPSPDWYISHVMVRELPTRHSWFFPAECWLAVSHGDGRVERELVCLRRGLGFWKLLYSKFTEYLEDVHVWISVYSRPSHSRYLHTPRLTVSFSLVCVYSCLTAVLTAVEQEQLPWGVGPADVTLGPFGVGLLCTLLASPGALLLSLLFRLSKEAIGPSPEGPWGSPGRLQREATWAPSSRFEGPAPLLHRLFPPWPGSVAWAVCGMVSIACGLGTGFLGYRFDPEQCGQWLHLLGLSVVCCVFLTQPLMICFMALSFAWKRKDDNDFFNESLQDATKNLESELEQLSSNCCIPDYASEFEKIFAARQRARHLRWVRPPSAAQLRVAKERTRKENRTQAALRDILWSILMLLLLLFIIYGKFSQDEHSVNQAIRNEFTRNARNSFSGLSSVDDWWDWSLTTLLDSLYWENPSQADMRGSQSLALGGKFYLIGTSVVKQQKASPNSVLKLPSPSSALTEDFLSACSPQVSRIDPENQNVTPGDGGGCREREDGALILGRTRSQARMALAHLRASRWVDRGTGAVAVHFALYNPPTRSFSSVCLRAEILPTGGLLPSSVVETFGVFHSDSALRYPHVFPELVFLALNLIHVWFHLYLMTEEGILNYWRKPSNWLELSVVGMGLAYCTASSYLVVLSGEAMDQIRKGLFRVFMDLSLIASWNQRTRWLQGILLFLWMFKCIYLLGLRKTMASCSLTIHRLISSIIAPGLAGVLVLTALSHLHRLLLFFTQPLPTSSFVDSVPRLLSPRLGRSPGEAFFGLYESSQRAMACYYGAFCTVTAILWFGMLKGSLLTFARKRKSSRSKDLVSLKDITTYVWEKTLTFLGLERPTLEDTKMVENHKYYLEEFSNLLDELLLKINGLSNSLQLPSLEKPPISTAEARTGDNPSVVTSDYHATGVKVPRPEVIQDCLVDGHPEKL
ncbi:polycystic kidney disease protein 1-like 1 [Choloepus didactylus]|uniref:polycystic kidney disease protein 1-like 1 n=1 Tax=Choloepus didactylus TaxID=27675 RepID=UPI00189D29FC|nr:polycystic kidney disease protein 1-like 1 [Choloepus didactylus]